MRTLLICHHDAVLDREGLARWLGSFSTVVGTVAIQESPRRMRKRVVREIKRVGWRRFPDVVAFRAYHALRHGRGDREWEHLELNRLRRRFPERPDASEIIVTSPNGADAKQFIAERRPDLVIARCKTLLKEDIFSIPRLGTFVMHPGICPEYRNAHGCFWALANGDIENIGMTLLKIDRGVDTGPVYGYFRVNVDGHESHVVTQHRTVLEHLDGVRDRLLDIEAGRATPIDTAGRTPSAWGQPWLSAHLRIVRRCSVLNPRERHRPSVSGVGVRTQALKTQALKK